MNFSINRSLKKFKIYPSLCCCNSEWQSSKTTSSSFKHSLYELSNLRNPCYMEKFNSHCCHCHCWSNSIFFYFISWKAKLKRQEKSEKQNNKKKTLHFDWEFRRLLNECHVRDVTATSVLAGRSGWIMCRALNEISTFVLELWCQATSSEWRLSRLLFDRVKKRKDKGEWKVIEISFQKITNLRHHTWRVKNCVWKEWKVNEDETEIRARISKSVNKLNTFFTLDFCVFEHVEDNPYRFVLFSMTLPLLTHSIRF